MPWLLRKLACGACGEGAAHTGAGLGGDGEGERTRCLSQARLHGGLQTHGARPTTWTPGLAPGKAPGGLGATAERS